MFDGNFRSLQSIESVRYCHCINQYYNYTPAKPSLISLFTLPLKFGSISFFPTSLSPNYNSENNNKHRRTIAAMLVCFISYLHRPLSKSRSTQ